MAMFSHRGESEDEEEIFDEDNAFDEDMEALRRACMLTGTNPNEIKQNPVTATTTATNSDAEGDSDESDDLELARSIRQRFAFPSDDNQPLSLKPLSSIPPVVSDDDNDDDFETLRAIERRFAKFESDTLKKNTKSNLHKPELVCDISTALERESSENYFVNKNYSGALGEEIPNSVEVCNTSDPLVSFSHTTLGNQNQPSDYIEWHQPEDPESSTLPPKYSGFPNYKPVQLFIDAIKKNRSCQKFIRSKLIQIEARIEENKRLKERVKLLKDFQVACKARAGRALSQKKDARVQLISVRKSRTKTFKDNDKKVRALYVGPSENFHVANYRMVLTKFPLSLHRQSWSDAAKENLGKGIKQQFQEMMLQKSLDLYSGLDESIGDSNDLDSIIASIAEVEFTTENVRSFLPKVDWERLASMYVPGHSGAECEARWLNSEDPLINHNPWTNIEDKNLLFVLQQRGLYNWIDIATALRTNRTPFQCLARYQRSLNAHIMKRDWTEDDDTQLRAAVEAFGEHDWQLIASNLEGRTGTQCSNRWRKTLNPARERVGRWAVEEDKRLKVAVMLFGSKWKKIAEFVPGRTQVQCRERWVNVLDPSLKLGEWTEEEDTMLKKAIAEHGHCWSKVAACIPLRTDNQCRRRWKVLLPHEVPLLQAARKIQKAALISNFVDREVERPALCSSDFLPIKGGNFVSEAGSGNNIGKKNKKSRSKPASKKQKDTASYENVPKKKSSKRSRTETQICIEEVLSITNGDVVEAGGGNDTVPKKKKAHIPRSKKITKGVDVLTNGRNGTVSKKARVPRSKKNKCAEPALGHQELPLFPEHLTCLTNGVDVEASAGNDNVSKKALTMQSKKNKFAESALGHQNLPFSPEPLACISNAYDAEAVCGDCTVSNKEHILRSKKNNCAEPAVGQQDLQLLLEPSTCITNGDDVESVGGVDTSSQREKLRKPPSKRNRCTKSAQTHQGISSSPKLLKISRITNGDDVETLGGDNTTSKKRKAPKFLLERGVQEHQDLLLLPEQSTADGLLCASIDKSSFKVIPKTRKTGSLRKVKQGLRKNLVISSGSSNMLGSECSEEQLQPHDANGASTHCETVT